MRNVNKGIALIYKIVSYTGCDIRTDIWTYYNTMTYYNTAKPSSVIESLSHNIDLIVYI